MSMLILIWSVCAVFFLLSLAMHKAEKRAKERKRDAAFYARLNKMSDNVKSAKRPDTAQRRIDAMTQEINSIRGVAPQEYVDECERRLRHAQAHKDALAKAEADHRAAEAQIKEYQRQQREKEKERKKAEKQKNITPEQIAHREFIAEQRRLMTDSLRYDIMRRDGFRCQLCGMTAKDGVKLHVDHIIAVSKSGKTEPSNLRTLCERCNLGKSNKTE